MGLKYTVIRAAFETLWLTGGARLFDRLSDARGVIWTLHRVIPEQPSPFAPNAILQIQPAFLSYCLERLADRKIDIVSIDEGLARLSEDTQSGQFVVLTFDDGYRDNLVHALPILEQANAPFTLYVPSAFPTGQGALWWQAIEDIIAANTSIRFVDDSGFVDLPSVTVAEKQSAFNRLYWYMRVMPERERLTLLDSFARTYGYDLSQQCRDLIMTWEELAGVAQNRLATIGAHTVNHYELAKLTRDEARYEMAQSVEDIEHHLGLRPRHFSYPLGGPMSCGAREFELAKELGFASAVTTRPGGLYQSHNKKRHYLPRVSLNGLFQNRRYVDIFASGGVFSQMGRVIG